MSPHAYLSYVPAFPKPSQKPKPEGYNPAFETMRDGREICRNHPETGTTEGRREYKRRIAAMLNRQNGICCLAGYAPMCPGPLALKDASFEHELSRGMGGGKRNDAITKPNGDWINGAAHYECNQWKSSRRIRYNI
jgi:hypothetical protein